MFALCFVISLPVVSVYADGLTIDAIKSVSRGDELTVTGSGAAENSFVEFYIRDSAGRVRMYDQLLAGEDGSFERCIRVPGAWQLGAYTADIDGESASFEVKTYPINVLAVNFEADIAVSAVIERTELRNEPAKLILASYVEIGRAHV